MPESGTVLLGVAGHEPTTPASMEVAKEHFAFRLESWIEQPAQVAVEVHDNSATVTWLGGPVGAVNDFQPRCLWGVREGRKFTLLDARMRVDTTWASITQRYESTHFLEGAFVEGPQVPVRAARYAFDRPDAGWLDDSGITTDGGHLESWRDQHHAGLIWTPYEPRSLHHVVHRFPTTLTALLNLWTNRQLEVSQTEVQLPDGHWHPVVQADQSGKSSKPGDLLDVQALDLRTVARWVDLAARLGPVPHIAVHEGLPLQAGAQSIATALESLDRRLGNGPKRFPTAVTNRRLEQAKKAARVAAIESLTDLAVDKQSIRRAFDEALGHIDEPTYAERLHNLLPEVAEVAPGLLGPHLPTWIETMKDIRNVQSHGTNRHDTFDQDEIARYYVHLSSGQWALKILLLLQLIDADRLGAALRSSDRFHFALANLDRERLWSDFSAYDTFTRH